MNIQPDPAGFERLLVTAPEFDASFEVSGKAPVQGFGSVLGRELYFRARQDSWTFEVADQSGHLPSDGFQNSDGFFREAVFPNASWMSNHEAVRIIVRCLQELTGVRAERPSSAAAAAAVQFARDQHVMCGSRGC